LVQLPSGYVTIKVLGVRTKSLKPKGIHSATDMPLKSSTSRLNMMALLEVIEQEEAEINRPTDVPVGSFSSLQLDLYDGSFAITDNGGAQRGCVSFRKAESRPQSSETVPEPAAAVASRRAGVELMPSPSEAAPEAAPHYIHHGGTEIFDCFGFVFIKKLSFGQRT
jgi:hypothetical protein